MRIKRILPFVLLLSALSSTYGRDTNVSDFMAISDGKEKTTEHIQRAIDECHMSGGGKVTVPPGRYLIGQIWLRSHVELYLCRGAVILGSTDRDADYIHSDREKSIITADGIEDAGISGEGTIDGQSETEDFRSYGIVNNVLGRPMIINFKDSRNLSIKGIRVINSQFWSVKMTRCDGLIINGITIIGHGTFNNDGLDIDSRNVIISNCIIDTDDDAICFKSEDPDFLPENITVTNCILASNCNAIKFGTASSAGFRNITVSNCTIHPTSVSKIRYWEKMYKALENGIHTALSGIAIEAVDGGIVEHIRINNISMCGVINPITIVLNHRNGRARMRDISINNVTAVCKGVLPCIISGVPGNCIEDVTLKDITVENAGGEKIMKTPVPENLDGYPENRMYGMENPASALYIRHAKNIVVENFHATTRHADERPDIVLDDVTALHAEKIISNGKKGKIRRLF